MMLRFFEAETQTTLSGKLLEIRKIFAFLCYVCPTKIWSGPLLQRGATTRPI